MTFGCLVGHVFLNVLPLWLSARRRMTSPGSSGILRRRRKAREPVTDRSVGSELTGIRLQDTESLICVNPHMGEDLWLWWMECHSQTDYTTGGRGGCDGFRHAEQSRLPPRVSPASRGTVNHVSSSLLHTRWVSHTYTTDGGDLLWPQLSTSGNRLSLLVLCFSVAADGPPEPCWYCLRTQESGSRPETGQQVFVFFFFDEDFRGNDFRVFY